MVIWFLKEETDDEEPIPQGMVEGAQVGSHQKHRFIFTVLVFVFVFEGGFKSSQWLELLWQRIRHAFIIIREVLILTLSIFGRSLGPRGVYFPIHPSSRQCTDSIFNLILVLYLLNLGDNIDHLWYLKENMGWRLVFALIHEFLVEHC